MAGTFGASVLPGHEAQVARQLNRYTPPGTELVYGPGYVATQGSVPQSIMQQNAAQNTSNGSNTQPSQPSQPTNTGPTVDQLMEQVNAAFGPVASYLDQAKSTLQGQQAGVEADIGSLAQQSKQELGTEKGISERQLGTQQSQGEKRREDAIVAARRLYNELARGGQQRFGGASSAGEAYAALGARELQRNRQGIQQNFDLFMQQVEGARTALQERYDSALQSLEAERVRRLNEARRDFQDRLLEISRMKAQAESDKANKRLEALQQLRNQMYQINLAKSQGDQYVNTLSQNLQNEIDGLTQAGSNQIASTEGAKSSFYSNANLNPSTALALNTGSASQGFSPTGVITQEDKDKLFGSVNPLLRTPRKRLQNVA